MSDLEKLATVLDDEAKFWDLIVQTHGIQSDDGRYFLPSLLMRLAEKLREVTP